MSEVVTLFLTLLLCYLVLVFPWYFFLLSDFIWNHPDLVKDLPVMFFIRILSILYQEYIIHTLCSLICPERRFINLRAKLYYESSENLWLMSLLFQGSFTNQKNFKKYDKIYTPKGSSVMKRKTTCLWK